MKFVFKLFEKCNRNKMFSRSFINATEIRYLKKVKDTFEKNI